MHTLSFLLSSRLDLNLVLEVLNHRVRRTESHGEDKEVIAARVACQRVEGRQVVLWRQGHSRAV